MATTAGIYNYHPKVDNPNQTFNQMKSDTFQPPFYFGGSQVPVNLHVSHGSGIRRPYNSHKTQVQDLQIKGHGFGCGIKTTSNKNDNIRLTKYMFHK
jgi:hypothetical protein